MTNPEVWRSWRRGRLLRVLNRSGASGDFTLVSVTPSTGVRHQIRVHLADAGFPIAGDELYGGAPTELGAGRFWPHLAEIELESPISGATKVSAPIPSELARLLT